MDGASPERLKEILRAIGPSIRRPAELGAALIRVMPDLRRAPDHERLIARVNPNGAGRTEPEAGPEPSASARVAESRIVDSASQSTDRARRTAAGSGARWRPYWWGLLRAWSSEHAFSLQRVDNDEMARAAGYVEGVVSLLDSDEDLAFHHWKEGFRRPSGMTDVHRIDVHAHIIHQAIGRIRASKKRDRAAVPPPYVDAVKKAFFLGLDDDVVDVAIAGRLQRPTTIALTRGMRVKATVGPGRPLDEVLEIHELVEDHARALGMSHDGTVSRATDIVAVTRWNLRSRAVARALRYRIPIVLIDDFLAAGLRDEIAGREIGFAAQRAAICGRCGIVHAFPARRIHRKDALCQGCR